MWTNKDIKIKPVDETNGVDFEILFQSKGGPGYCWCMVWRMTKDKLKHNKFRMQKRIIKTWCFGRVYLSGYQDM